LAFFIGFGIGTQVAAYMLRHREQHVSTKVRQLNSVTRHVYRHTGLNIAPWLIDLPKGRSDVQPYVVPPVIEAE
jgi:hypothetical protein